MWEMSHDTAEFAVEAIRTWYRERWGKASILSPKASWWWASRCGGQ